MIIHEVGASDEVRFARLLRARHPFILIHTFEEKHAFELVRKVAREHRNHVHVWSASEGLVHCSHKVTSAVADTETAAAMLSYLNMNPQEGKVTIALDLIEHLEHATTLRVMRDAVRRMREQHGHLVLIDYKSDLPPVLEAAATRFEISLPDEGELARLVKQTLKENHARLNAKVKVSVSTWKMILKNLQGLTRRQAQQIILDAIAEDSRFDDSDLNTVLARKRQILHKDGLLEYVESFAGLDEIAGFKRLKEWLRMRDNARTGDARAHGLNPPRGILMLGVPGAGKSLCAKAVATAWGQPLLRLDPSVLYNKYIGESERRLRDALKQAEAMSPIVLWIDEIEKGFASAASKSVDGGLSQRMFGTLLTWMQEHRAAVFLIATANNIDALPAELLRKGRFDEVFFVDLPSRDVRKAIFRVHLKKRRMAPEKFDLERLADASEGYTGAEIEQAIVSALHRSVAKDTKLTTDSVFDAIKSTHPLSVTMAEYVQRIRVWAEGRCVPVD